MQRVVIGLIAALVAIGFSIDGADAAKRRKGKPQAQFAAKAKKIDLSPQVLQLDLGLAPGTIVIVNDERRLYLVQPDGRAKRYRVAVGERNELWTGRTFVSAKRENPDWNPVDGKSQPMKGGDPGNPLGVRALYLDWGLLRIHGTANPGSIGGSVSNGCIRMYNQDVIDLYEQVHLGAPVLAVNTRAEIAKFASDRFTGKLPAWEGQAELWKQREKEAAVRQAALEAGLVEEIAAPSRRDRRRRR